MPTYDLETQCAALCAQATMPLQREAFHVGVVTGAVVVSLLWALGLLWRNRKKG